MNSELRIIADATIASLEDWALTMPQATDAALLDTLNELGVNNAMSGYIAIRELLRREREDDFEHPTPSAGSEVVNVRIVE